MSLPRTSAALALGLSLLVGCAPRPTESAADPGVVNVYSGRHYDADAEIFKRFEAATGIAVRTLEAPGPQLIERLKAEGAYAQADLVITTDAANLAQLEAEGLLQPVQSPVLDETIPAHLRDDDGYWFGLSKRARVIAYAKADPAAAAVTSYDDLAAPAFRGKVCVRSATNVYNLSLLAERIARDGPEAAQRWASGVKANLARDPQGSDTDQLKAVAAGACSLALVNHYYFVRLQTSEDPQERAAAERIGLLFPDAAGAGAHVNISGAGVAKHAPNRDNALKLLEFLVGPEAQAAFAALNDEYPVRADAPSGEALAALGAWKESATPLAALAQHQAQAQRIYDEAGWR
jgi:iron(III) transport system substrate-binding protein